jgi:hypothetical protein
LSLCDLASSIGVSRVAPYNHFTDRRASSLGVEGLRELAAGERSAIGACKMDAADLSVFEAVARTGSMNKSWQSGAPIRRSSG